MARIRIVGADDVLLINVAGRLLVTDLGRLERACASALVSHPLRLELDLTAVTAWDAPARAMIDRLAGRGAAIVVGAAPPAAHATDNAVPRRLAYRHHAPRSKAAISPK